MTKKINLSNHIVFTVLFAHYEVLTGTKVHTNQQTHGNLKISLIDDRVIAKQFPNSHKG